MPPYRLFVKRHSDRTADQHLSPLGVQMTESLQLTADVDLVWFRTRSVQPFPRQIRLIWCRQGRKHDWGFLSWYALLHYPEKCLHSFSYVQVEDLSLIHDRHRLSQEPSSNVTPHPSPSL